MFASARARRRAPAALLGLVSQRPAVFPKRAIDDVLFTQRITRRAASRQAISSGVRLAGHEDKRPHHSPEECPAVNTRARSLTILRCC
jgi:hypothetical protein